MYIEAVLMEQQGTCEMCNKKLRSFTVTFDWRKRKLHKSCWKKEQDQMQLDFMMEQYKAGLL